MTNALETDININLYQLKIKENNNLYTFLNNKIDQNKKISYWMDAIDLDRQQITTPILPVSIGERLHPYNHVTKVQIYGNTE